MECGGQRMGECQKVQEHLVGPNDIYEWDERQWLSTDQHFDRASYAAEMFWSASGQNEDYNFLEILSLWVGSKVTWEFKEEKWFHPLRKWTFQLMQTVGEEMCRFPEGRNDKSWSNLRWQTHRWSLIKARDWITIWSPWPLNNYSSAKWLMLVSSRGVRIVFHEAAPCHWPNSWVHWGAFSQDAFRIWTNWTFQLHLDAFGSYKA